MLNNSIKILKKKKLTSLQVLLLFVRWSTIITPLNWNKNILSDNFVASDVTSNTNKF